ncbi:ATP-binding protein [Neolewinella lacunae]|uniref:histidine kinase n=1 Tax=Neolewinella lacunae TaxID=1517758 RepID=A0A923TCW5_9BACT|nr:ATP-binding protein [Neolewinella lacunae]MBC6994182.1 response regulator [Neolewinella lacunae]MDN3634659.1 ATP-binding protein [Neolewinella lacunae]
MKACVTIFLVLFLLPTRASDTIPVHAYGDDAHDFMKLSRKCGILLDPSGALTIEDILRDSSLQFYRLGDRALPPLPFVSWNRIRVTNTGTKTRHDVFANYIYSDSVWMYTVDGKQVVAEGLAGGAVHPHNKYFPNVGADFPFSLAPGQTRDYYFRAKYVRSTPYLRSSLHLLTIFPGKTYRDWMDDNKRQEFFYAGILCLCGLVSFFMYTVFREKIFIYFGTLMLALAGYFLDFYNELGALFNFTQEIGSYVRHLLVLGLVGSLFLFIKDFLDLREQQPAFHRPYLGASGLLLLVILANTVFGFWIPTPVISLGIIGWSLVSIALIGYLAWRGSAAGKILLISISFLCLGGLALLLSGFGIFDTTLTSQAFKIGVLLFSGILFYGLFDRVNAIRRAKSEAEELNDVKSRIFANITHEFRTPLTLMLGPLEQLLSESTDPQQRKLLQLAHRNAERQLSLVNQLLDLSKAESGHLPLRATEQDFIPFLKGAVYAYTSLAEQKNIALQLHCPEDSLLLYFDREKMEQIIYNLLSNAFKFTPEGGQVTVTLRSQKEGIKLDIQDSGIGIPEHRLQHVFDRFFREEAAERGNFEGYGIGLALVKELVQLHRGSVSLQSKVDVGTTVTLTFPLGSKHLAAEQIVLTEAIAPRVLPPLLPLGGRGASQLPLSGGRGGAPAAAPASTPQPDQNTLLLVEDNADVRAFIRQRLVPKFLVLEAVNGQEGIEMAILHTPDLIISDVMMPDKNGYELCQTLKTDVRTSHIPIILLTAKAAREEKLEGLETGADAYLTKPFDARELAIRVDNLIQTREQLRKRFATAIELKPEEITANSIDQSFLQSALHVVEAHLAEENFSVEDLAQALNMSRSNLNRKLRALINQSSNQFIQSVRLQRAADLLRQRAGTVGEIAFQTGFSSTAYFVKCFKDKYGQTPGTFLESH